jgi:DNA segregation ATPase FtsK/SpoIIIE-like protein
MEIILLIIGFVLGWIVHSVLSFKKFGKELNQLKKENWKNKPREERVKIRLEGLRKIMPNMPEDELEIMAYEHDNEEFLRSSLVDEGIEELYDKAKILTEKEGKISSAKIMEELSIGYTRSATIMDLLEEREIVNSEGNLIN